MGHPHAIVVVSNAVYTLLPSTFAELAEGLRGLGHPVSFHRIDGAHDYQVLCEEVRARSCRGEDFFVLDGNCKLRLPGDGQGLRRFSYVTDAPWGQIDNIQVFPAGGSVSYVDRSHGAFYRDFPFPLQTVFLPHGGPQLLAGADQPRDIDLLFIGNLATPARMEQFRESIASLPPPLPQVFTVSLEMLLEEGLDPYAAFKVTLLTQGLTVADLGLDNVVNGLDFLCRFAESHNRWRLLTSLWDLPVSLYGLVDDRFFDRLPDNVTYGGIATEEQVIALMSRCKVLLNSVSVFPQGGHERLWYGLACGAAICTDHSQFVAESLTYGRHLLDLEEARDSRGETLRPWLTDEPGRRDMVNAAREIYVGRHTWRHRAAIIQQAMAVVP